MASKVFAVDSDLRPVRTHALTRAEGEALIETGEAYCLMPLSSYVLAWASRFGESHRWRVFPKEVTA